MSRSRLIVVTSALCVLVAAPVLAHQDMVDPAVPPPPPAVEKPVEPMNAPAAPSGVKPEPAQMWDIVSTTRIGSLSAGTSNASVCLSDADLNRPPAELGGLRCTVHDFQNDGSTLTWTGTCGDAEGVGELVFSEDRKSFTGSVSARQGGLESTMALKGHVTGACVK